MSLPSRPVAVAVAWLLSAAVVSAAVPAPPEASRYKPPVYQMRAGNKRFKDDPKHREAVKTIAEWLAFTICTPPYNGEPVPPTDRTPIGARRDMNLIMSDARSLSNVYSGSTGQPNQAQLEFADEFGKAIADATGVVLNQSGKLIERINAVRLLAVAAENPAPSLFAPLVAIVNNPKASDAEKLYAFQGLRNLLEQPGIENPNWHIIGGTAGDPKLAEVGQALNNYIMQKRSPANAKETAVIQFVRREAVAALAKFKDGVIRKPNKDLLFRPAWAMARVMEQDPTVSPPFTMHEQIEAAIGLAGMKIDPDMNLDVAAYTMAKVLVLAAQAANLDHERANSTKTLPVLPWKTLAARWSYALSVWRENAKALPASRNPGAIREVANAGIGMLTELEKNGAAGRTAAGVQDLTNWATNNPPKAFAEMRAALLFQDDPGSRLPIPVPVAPANPKLNTPEAPMPKAAPPAKKAG